jgi:putative spermidine/putrescine transport system permease protein
VAGVTAPKPEKGRRTLHLPPAYILLSLPPVVYLLALFFVPLAFLLVVSVYRFDAGLVTSDLTLANYERFFTDSFYLAGFLRTLQLSTLVAGVVTLVSYPVAYFLTRTQSRFKGLLLALVLAPELSGVVLRTYGWMVILEDRGLINNLLIGLNLLDTPLRLSQSFTGVTIGLIHVLLPFGILAIFSTLQSIDPILERAAQNLGANRIQTFFRVLLPLSLPGILGAFVLSFTLTASAYATPAILGGSGFHVLATMIYRQLLFFLNWPLAAVMSIVLLLSVLVVVLLGNRLESRIERAVQG